MWKKTNSVRYGGIFRIFRAEMAMGLIPAIRVLLESGKEKNGVLKFSWRFRRFQANKSSKQNAETEQARPQLYFAPKIIKIHLVVLENELIEVCIVIPKKYKKRSFFVTHSCVYVYWNFVERPLNEQYYRMYMHEGVTYGRLFSALFWNQHANFNQLVLQDYQMDFDDFWC